MEELLFDTEYSTTKNVQRIPDSHLQSPIRDVYRKFLHSSTNKWPGFLYQALSTIPVDRHQISINSELIYGDLLNSVYHYSTSIRLEWVYHNYPECCEATTKFLHSICDKLNLPLPGCRTKPNDKDMLLISIKILWDEVRTVMQECRVGRDKWVDIHNLPPNVGCMHVCSQFALCQLTGTDNKWFVFDYDQIMMIADTIASRVFCIIYNDMLPLNIPGKLPAGLLEKCYRIYDGLFPISGNMSYKYIARWESVCMATLLKKYDRLQRSSSYYDWLTSDLIEEQDGASQNLLDLLMREELTAEVLSELHGIYRHWGHPTVQEDLGCEKVRDIAQNRPIPSITTLNQMSGALKRQFILSFISKHGRWPTVINMSVLKDMPIYNLIESQSRVVNLYSPEYPLSHWGLIRFGKEFEFDYHLDYTDLLEDKSISVYRSEIRGIYSSDALGYKPKQPSTDRRVLRETLKRESIDVKNICRAFQLNEIPEEWKIIIVHSKEREIKIAPRLFAMMTFEARLYYSVTEANIRDTIFPYFPQQTMTLDEADLSKRLLTLTTTPDGLIKILSSLLGIDFSSWNICWTYLSTLDVFQFLDDLFGTPGLYIRTHPFFEDCLVALASHHNPPTSLVNQPVGEPTSCNELWYNHRGGFEGLRQKGWTLCTIGLLLLVEATTGLKSYVIGQGDNQVCKLMIPLPDGCESVDSYISSDQEEINQTIDKFIVTLQQLAGKIGLHVKKEETWVGTDILTYGKEILYRGAFMPQGLKRISRLLTDVNEIYPSLHTKIATLQTAGMACSQKSYDIITPYFICTVEVLMTICRDVLHFCNQKLIDKRTFEYFTTIAFKEFILCLSSDVGGCPLLSFISFLYRGHPDPLTTYTTWLHLLSKDFIVARRLYRWLQERHYHVGRGDSELLVSNPCALNLEGPETISTKLRRDLETALINYTKNKDLKEIFSTASRKNDTDLFTYLVSLDPCHPRVFHEIFRNTVTGAKLSFISKFSNTRTTQTLLNEKVETSDMLRVVRNLELQLINHWVGLYRNIISIPSEKFKQICPTMLAQSLRDDTWARTTNGKSIEGVTIPHPVHQFSYHSSQDPVQDLTSNTEQILLMIPTRDKATIINTRGPYSAYIGSTTKEKRSGKMYSIPMASRPLKSAERLIQLRNWMTNEGTSTHDFLTELATCRTNIPLPVLEDITTPIIGGSVIHRLDDHVTKRGTLHNVRPNITTHTYYTTDTMGRFSRGSVNYNMHFQGVVHTGLSFLQIVTVHNTCDLHEYSTMRYQGACCESQLNDFVLTSERVSPVVRVSADNPLLYAQMNYIPPAHTPRAESFCHLVRSSRYGEAIGFLLFSRCMSANHLYHLGLTEHVNPLVGPIGIAEVIGVGLKDILFHLAKYIYLSLPSDSKVASEFFHSLPSRVFSDLATLCLLPEIIHELCEMSGFSSLPDMFCNKEVVCNLIKRILERFLYDFLNFSDIQLSESYQTVYYLSTSVGLHQILNMWSKQICIITNGKVDLKKTFSKTYQEHATGHFIPNIDFIQNLILNVIQSEEPYIVQLLCRVCPLKISQVPVQVTARESRSMIPLRSFRLYGIRSYSIKKRHLIGLEKPYPLTLNCDLEVLDTETKDLTRSRSLLIHTPKNRVDQTYRLYGSVSTAFLKLLEIIMTENWRISGSAITLAEGEGSMAELLTKLGADFVYYNTLIEREKLVEQRATSLIPTCMIGHPDKLKMGDLTALTGGDLTQHCTLQSILHYITNVKICITTCDAESAGTNNPSLTNKIVLAWAAVCMHSKSTYGILKSFSHNADTLAQTVGTAAIIYDKVSVIVPCYSSNETHEVYIKCSGFNPKSALSDILWCHESGQIITAKNSEILRSPLMLFKRDRIQDEPFQSTHLKKTKQLLKCAKDLKFEDNVLSNLHRLVLFNAVYDNTKITDWLANVSRSVYTRSLTTIKLQSASYHGDPMRYIQPQYIPKHHVLHNQIESYITCMTNCRILLNILDVGEKYIVPVVSQILQESQDLVYQGKLLYRFNIDEDVWRRSYLKSVCRVWGHKNRSEIHQCHVDWD